MAIYFDNNIPNTSKRNCKSQARATQSHCYFQGGHHPLTVSFERQCTLQTLRSLPLPLVSTPHPQISNPLHSM